MIRCVQIGNQIYPHSASTEFAFWDTILDEFLAFDGGVVFSSVAEFREYAATSGAAPEHIARCLRLIPDKLSAITFSCSVELAEQVDRAAELMGVDVDDFVRGAVALEVRRGTGCEKAPWRSVDAPVALDCGADGRPAIEISLPHADISGIWPRRDNP